MSDAAVENHHPPGTPIVTPAQPPLNDNNNAAAGGDNAQAADPDQEQVQELESELSKLKVRACRIITSIYRRTRFLNRLIWQMGKNSWLHKFCPIPK